mmetsp:Transcript_132130/g.422733  ORF Transcript_132130/g.422733 Transcript_132130/m.422733 type:complete len:215 (+) Transcript_132130:112-756(+)
MPPQGLLARRSGGLWFPLVAGLAPHHGRRRCLFWDGYARGRAEGRSKRLLLPAPCECTGFFGGCRKGFAFASPHTTRRPLRGRCWVEKLDARELGRCRCRGLCTIASSQCHRHLGGTATGRGKAACGSTCSGSGSGRNCQGSRSGCCGARGAADDETRVPLRLARFARRGAPPHSGAAAAGALGAAADAGGAGRAGGGAGAVRHGCRGLLRRGH